MQLYRFRIFGEEGMDSLLINVDVVSSRILIPFSEREEKSLGPK